LAGARHDSAKPSDPNVRVGSFPDLGAHNRDFRFIPMSRRRQLNG
jgi:hypothetical protein